METPESRAGNVFGSPPEPIFNESKHGVSTELLEDNLKLLTEKNDTAVDQSKDDETEGHFKQGNPVLFLFELCSHFGLPPEVKYWAAELFHQFMLNHITELYQHVAESSKTESPIQWEDVEGRLKHQIPLRAVSCVQLASKLSSHYGIVSVGRAKNFLTSCGFRYATASIVQSEMRVLKTLDYQVTNPTPVEFTETLLEALGHNSPDIRAKQIHGVALKVLDVFYLCRIDVYSILKNLSKGNAAAIEADFMLLAAAVITASAFILDQSKCDDVIQQLATVSCIANNDILSFATVLLQQIFKDQDRD